MTNDYQTSRTEQKAQEYRRRADAYKSACAQQQRDLAALYAEANPDTSAEA